MRPGPHAVAVHPPIVIRPPGPHDGKALWSLAQVAGLDLNSPYAYVLWSDYHRTTSLVAAVDDDVVGFVLGFRIPDEPDEVFVWQIAVDPAMRGSGLGSTLLDTLVARTGATAVVATVTPSNEPSDRLFRGLAERHGGTVRTTMAYEAALFPGDHEDEVRYRIDLDADDRRDAPRRARGESHLGDL